MEYTPKIHKAIKFSIKTHDVYQKQKRKGKDISYITHPLTVGVILARVGADEEVVAAGILHDTIEDSISEKKVTREMISERFGDRVADIVASVTEMDKDMPWEERKQEALDRVGDFNHDSLLVKSADIISNVAETVDDYARYGDKVFERFNAPKDRVLNYNFQMMEKISARWPENPLLEDLQFLKRKLEEVR